MGWGSNLKTVVKKYGRVAIGVHLSVSGLCFSGCYLAILNSVDVEGILKKVGLESWIPPHESEPVAALPDVSGLGRSPTDVSHPSVGLPAQHSGEDDREAREGALVPVEGETQKKNWSLAKGGGAFAMAWLCNKALFPVRVPITIGLTPPVWRFLHSRGFRV